MQLSPKSLTLHLIIIAKLIVSSLQCHYTCKECSDNNYNRCTKCLDNRTLLNTYNSTPAKGYCAIIHS